MKRILWLTPVLGCLLLCSLLVLQAAAADPQLKKIIFEKTSSNEERIFLVLNGEYLPNTFGMEGKRLRLVCDFPGMQIGEGVERCMNTGGDLVKRVRIGLHRVPSSKVRVVLDLAPGYDYDVQPQFFKKEQIFSIAVRVEKRP